MTIAEIHGKISSIGSNLSDRMEDLLTSDTFGCMRYLPPETLLIPFLNKACSLWGNTLSIPEKIVDVHCLFWPWINTINRKPCEPDVVIGFELHDNQMHLVMIEAKYNSGLSSEEDEGSNPNDQLARELDNLDVVSPNSFGWKKQYDVISRTLVFITTDIGIPRKTMEQSYAEYQKKRNTTRNIYWVSWSSLTSILEQALLVAIDTNHHVILSDMLNLLLKKGLIGFRGVEPVSLDHLLPSFYQIGSHNYNWSGNESLRSLDYVYEAKRNDRE